MNSPENKIQFVLAESVTENQKIAFIHILRGLAIVMVLAAHIPGLWLLNRNQVWSVFQFYKIDILAPLQISDGGGHLGVIVFFLISGYIISTVAQKETRIEFLIKRFFRLFPTLFVCCAIAYVLVTISNVFAIGPIYSTDAVNVIDFIKSAFMLSWFDQTPRALSVAWSLMPELIFYSWVFFLINYMRNSPMKSTFLMLMAYMLMTFPMSQVPYLSYFGYFTVYMPVFFIGRILYLDQQKKITTQQTLALLVFCSAIFITIYNGRFPGELFRADSGRIWNYVFGIAIFYGLMHSNIKSCPRIISFFADISYSLYLVHLPVGMFILNLMDPLHIPFAIKCVVAISTTIASAVIIHFVIEKPAQRMARRVLSKVELIN
jgi:exopolysaccharide production protein ExoZ